MIPVSELKLVKIGEIIRAHGYEGEAVIKLTVNFDQMKLTELIFLETEGNMVPFFFSYSPKPYKKSGMLAKLDNINSDKEVEKLIYAPVFLPAQNIIPESKENSFIPENFDVFNNDTFIGKSGNILNIPSNPVLTVYTADNKEILIPVNDIFLKEINIEKKTIIFNLPEGLIEING